MTPNQEVVLYFAKYETEILKEMLINSLCVRDLRVYAQSIDGEVFHYRDKSGPEADAIVHLKDGRWGAIEVKIDAKKIEDAAENLKTLRDKVNLDKMKNPSFLMGADRHGIGLPAR